SKDGSRVYAFFNDLSAGELTLESVQPRAGSTVRLLGYSQPLQWKAEGKGVKITIPKALQIVENQPCRYMWGVVIQNRTIL
ncbi:MAG: hypothetical protein LBS63_02355, partial [Prevotellaceae bacterium]|nr:hypothetical protein [Prevotellaceae bacterium]